MAFDYRHQKVALLTKHGKESIIAPILWRTLGCQVEHISAVDTDELGTFDRLVDRQGTQLQTARRKAHMGIDSSPYQLGVASEGSFVPDPFSGFMPWNVEIVTINNGRWMVKASIPTFHTPQRLCTLVAVAP